MMLSNAESLRFFGYLCSQKTGIGMIRNIIILALLVLLLGCEGSTYRKSLEEIDAMADDYPAQAKLFLSRADSTKDVAYYNLIEAKIDVRQEQFLFRHHEAIDRSIQAYKEKDDSAGLARALCYKGVMTLYGGRDTMVARQYFEQSERLYGIHRNKPLAELYDIRCQMGDTAAYIPKLRQVASAIGDTLFLARSYLYEAMTGANEDAADKAFALLDILGDEKITSRAYHEYVRALIDTGAPDSVIMRYLPKAQTHLSSVAYFTVTQYLYDHPHPEFTCDYLRQHGVSIWELDRKIYSFNSVTYSLMADMYFVAKRQGDQAMADSIAQAMRPMEYIFDEERNSHMNKEVGLMYEGGHTRFQFNKTLSYVMYGIMALLLLSLLLAVLYIRRMKRTNRMILMLTESIHQLKDIENPQLAERCEQLSRDIAGQLRCLQRRDSDIEVYKQQILHLEEVRQGLVTYSRILQDENISQIGRKGINQFLDSYQLIDEDYARKLSELDLNPSERLFCILYHLGKTDDQVMQILQYSLSNIRVRKSRIKAATEVDSFDELITK